jgi:hypothetical protein
MVCRIFLTNQFIGNLCHLRWDGSLRGPKYNFLKFGDINAKVVEIEGAKMYLFIFFPKFYEEQKHQNPNTNTTTLYIFSLENFILLF